MCGRSFWPKIWRQSIDGGGTWKGDNHESTQPHLMKNRAWTENDPCNTGRRVVADLPATWSYTYLWETAELKWAITEGLVPDIEAQDCIVYHKTGLIYNSHSCSCVCAHAHTEKTLNILHLYLHHSFENVYTFKSFVSPAERMDMSQCHMVRFLL